MLGTVASFEGRMLVVFCSAKVGGRSRVVGCCEDAGDPTTTAKAPYRGRFYTLMILSLSRPSRAAAWSKASRGASS